MTALFARLGPLEPRTIPHTSWTGRVGRKKSGKRWTAGRMGPRGGYGGAKVVKRGYAEASQPVRYVHHDIEGITLSARYPDVGFGSRSPAGWGSAPDRLPPAEPYNAAAVGESKVEAEKAEMGRLEAEKSADIADTAWLDDLQGSERDAGDAEQKDDAFDYVNALDPALAKGNSDVVLRCLSSARNANDVQWIRDLSDAQYTECLQALHPSNFADTLLATHLEVSHAMTKLFNLTPMRQITSDLHEALSMMINVRRVAGRKLTAEMYSLLLAAAANIGHKYFALRLWEEMVEDGIAPTVDNYNCRIGASVWQGVFDPVTRRNIRVSDFNMRARSAEHPGTRFWDYRTGEGGLHGQIMGLFGDMLKNEIVPNEETFCLVMIGAGREGSMSQIKSVMRKVWNVHMDAVMVGDEELSSQIPEGNHPSQRPTNRLLFTIAHVLGVNGHISMAFRIVDFVARRHDMLVTTDVWSHLFEFTFVMASHRSKTRRHNDSAELNHLPKTSVQNLWDALTSPPYNCQPTTSMYDHLIRSLQHRQSGPQILSAMETAYPLYLASRDRAHTALHDLQTRISRGRPPTSTSARSIPALRRNWEYLELRRRRDWQYVRRWLRLLLTTTRNFVHRDVHHDSDFSLRTLPRMLAEWHDVAPTTVEYDIPAGIVELRMRTREDIVRAWERKLKEKEKEEAILRDARLAVGDEWSGVSRERERAVKIVAIRKAARKVETGEMERDGSRDDVV